MTNPIQIAQAVPAPAAATAATSPSQVQAPASYLMPQEPPNIATIIEAVVNPKYEPHNGQRPHPAQQVFGIPINSLFSIALALVVIVVVRKALRNASIHQPGKLQMFVEMVMGGLHRFFLSSVGEDGRRFIPYLGSLFIFIWINNVASLLPGMKSPTSSIKTTAALAIVTIIYARYQNIRAAGLKGYIYHLLGAPTDAITWAMSPLFLILEGMGEIIKPLSLALRLYGNIFGEDKLLATFLGLGMMIVAVAMGSPTPPVGIPLHLPFYFLILLLSTIQAVVFSLLAGIYIMLMMPHKHEEEHPAAQ
ncbi:MAG: F0F1 ATP synthase subunit A [Candidatus Sumerlaeia bacterium]